LEFAEDHLPGAISAPVLDDAQRAEVGTLHARVGAFEAKRLGAALVSRNIGDILQSQFANQPRDWKPLVYCWRGGNRSGALATVMARIGWRTTVIEGGYKAYRRKVIEELQSKKGAALGELELERVDIDSRLKETQGNFDVAIAEHVVRLEASLLRAERLTKISLAVSLVSLAASFFM
jgi:rhodanese-related sulfurtransferase